MKRDNLPAGAPNELELFPKWVIRFRNKKLLCFLCFIHERERDIFSSQWLEWHSWKIYRRVFSMFSLLSLKKSFPVAYNDWFSKWVSSASATKSCFAFNVEYMRMAFMKNMQKSVFNVFAGVLNGDKNVVRLTMIGCRSLILLVPSRGSWKWNHCQRLTIYIFCHCSSKYTYQNKELHVSEWYLSFISCAGNRHNADTPTHTTSSLPDVESSSSSWSWQSW